MKTLLKILTPTMSALGIATISLAGCATPDTDNYVAIPTQYLNIEGTSLSGLKDGDEGAYVDLAKLGYSKLTITKEITNVSDFNYTLTDIGYKAITKIDFEERNATTTISLVAFSSLPELKVLEFPTDCRKIILNEHSFIKCNKLDTIDFSKVTNGFSAEFSTIEWASNLPDKGTFYANSSNKTEVESIRTILGLDTTNWPVIVK